MADVGECPGPDPASLILGTKKKWVRTRNRPPAPRPQFKVCIRHWSVAFQSSFEVSKLCWKSYYQSQLCDSRSQVFPCFSPASSCNWFPFVRCSARVLCIWQDRCYLMLLICSIYGLWGDHCTRGICHRPARRCKELSLTWLREITDTCFKIFLAWKLTTGFQRLLQIGKVSYN